MFLGYLRIQKSDSLHVGRQGDWKLSDRENLALERSANVQKQNDELDQITSRIAKPAQYFNNPPATTFEGIQLNERFSNKYEAHQLKYMNKQAASENENVSTAFDGQTSLDYCVNLENPQSALRLRFVAYWSIAVNLWKTGQARMDDKTEDLRSSLKLEDAGNLRQISLSIDSCVKLLCTRRDYFSLLAHL